MTAHAAEFFTMDKVNRLKIIQDVVVQPLTTLMAAQRLDISDSHSQRLLLRYLTLGLRCQREIRRTSRCSPVKILGSTLRSGITRMAGKNSG